MRGALLLDGRAMVGHSGVRGIGTYTRGLVAGLAALEEAPPIELLLFRGDTVPGVLAAAGVTAGPSVPRLKRRLQPAADAVLVAAALRGSRAGLYHGVEWGQPLRARIPVVETVHDLIPWVIRDGYEWQRRERLLALRQLRSADAVVAVSDCTADDVARLARVERGSITVIPHGVDPVFRPASEEHVDDACRRHGLRRPYLMCVGTFEPRKRIEVVAATVARLRRDLDIELAVCGDQGVYSGPVDAALTVAGIEAATRLRGFVGVDDLVALYSGAAAFLFPSSYEGFGLPLLEAMACGTPVVAFDNSAIGDVAGDAAVLVGDGDVDAFTAAVRSLLDEPLEESAARAVRGRQWAARFTWERSARAHLEVYDRLAG